jgi:hypothetical protein
MQECTSTGKDSFTKRVTVRSGGAGHAHSGIVKADGRTAATAAQSRGTKTTNIMIVRLDG